jgi:hypothetical protein
MPNNDVNKLVYERQWVRAFFFFALNFLKSTQIFNFPFFLGTTTIGDRHVTSYTDLMIPIISDLSMFYLMITI